MINLPIFGQRDSRWSGKFLGTSKVSTLGGYGCLITSWAMVCKYYGKDTDPDRLNTALVAVKGFSNDSYFNWGSVARVYSDIIESQNVQTPNPVTAAQFAAFDAELAAGRPIIIGVDFNPGTVLVESHFIVIVGGSNGQYTIADPWYGDTASLSRYGDPAKTIQRFVFTSGPIPTTNYKGIDLTNTESVKIAIDAWADLVAGNLVRKSDVEQITKDLNQKLVDQATAYEKEKAGLNTQIKALQDSLQSIQTADSNWQTQADVYQRKLKAIVDEFSTVGLSLAVESDETVLVGAISTYLTDSESARTFVAKVLSESSIKTPDAVLEALQEAKTNNDTIDELNKQIGILNGSTKASKTIKMFGLTIRIFK